MNIRWMWCDDLDVKNEDEETAVPGVNYSDVKNEDESDEMKWWENETNEWKMKWNEATVNEMTPAKHRYNQKPSVK